MSAKRAKKADIGGLLAADNFGNDASTSAASLPLEPTMMRLPLDRIKPYDRNPRKSKNDKFDEIVESIIDKGGVTSTISVTQRPGEDVFMVSAGGNTRLLAQIAAFEQTGREDLGIMSVMFVPYDSEITLLIDHLIENDMRSGNTFIEKALALKEIMVLVQSGAEVGELSQRNWMSILKRDYSYSVSRTVFIAYQYATDKLSGAIPHALTGGMGKPRVEAISKLEKRLSRFAIDQGVMESTFSTLFQQSLSDCDTEGEFVIADLESTAMPQLGQLLGGQTTSSVRTAIELFELGQQPVEPTTNAVTPGNDEPPERLPEFPPSPVSQNITHESELIVPPILPSNTSAETVDTSTIPGVSIPLAESDESQFTTAALDDARSSALRQAKLLAGYGDCQQLIQRFNAGYGFFIDLPDTEFERDSDRMTWWLLMTLSSVLGGGDYSLLPDNSVLKQVVQRSADEEAFFASILPLVGNPEFGQLGSFLTDPTLPTNTLLSLLTAIQRIRQFPDSQLWTGEE